MGTKKIISSMANRLENKDQPLDEKKQMERYHKTLALNLNGLRYIAWLKVH